MKTLKTILAATVVLGFLAGCAEETTPAQTAPAKSMPAKTSTYSSKLGTESTKKDTAK